MSKIKILPPDLINKIAAGEVVERPASVVKELVENSIDAGATHITVEISDAGKKLIGVIDDGSGMTEDEIKLSLQRHSTSKISSIDDLFNIQTLGFRGEALPSIDSISKMSIGQNQSGKGLSIRVKDIFYNTPVRLKFLKSNYTEIRHIQDHVTRFILSNPNISFRLVVDNKEVLSSPGNGKLFDAIFSVYGLDIARELVEVRTDKVFGYVSKPTLSRMDRGCENFFVNSRGVQNFLLSRALEDSYRNLIPNNRYPVAILFINVAPCDVDVNVHPSKREVKFLNNKLVMDSVRDAAGEALKGFGGGEEAGIEVGKSDWFPKVDFAQQSIPNIHTGILTPALTPETIEVTDIMPLIPLYQLLDTYIICTDGADLVLIDQHAAHERILFDLLGNEKRVTGNELQILLIPETLEFNSTDVLIVMNNIQLIKELGFDLEEFGKDSFILRAVPSFLLKESPKEILADMISELANEEIKKQPDKKRDRINKFIACRGAVKAGDKLTISEIQGLIRDLYKTENPATCPHGRPTMVRFGKSSLEKIFERS